MKSRWEKFKHRTLTKVFLGYAVVAWVLIQVIEAVLPTFETPLWVAQTITFSSYLGLSDSNINRLGFGEIVAFDRSAY